MSKINIIVADSSTQSPAQNTEEVDTSNPSAGIETDATATGDKNQIVVPDTGAQQTQGYSESTLPLPGLLISLILIVSFIFIMFRKQISRIIQAVITRDDKIFYIRPSRKTLFTAGVTAAFIVAAAVFLPKMGASSMFALADDTLPVSVSGDIEITVNPDNEDTFAVGQHTVKVATQAEYGYTLYAYPATANLLSETDENLSIPSIVSSNDTSILKTNNWGVSTIIPESANSQVWWSMSQTKQDEPFVVKVTSSPDDDATQVYYGVNINKELPKGVYSNTVEYVAVTNPAPEGSSADDRVSFPDPLSNPVGSDDEQEEDDDNQTIANVSTYSLVFSANQGTRAPARQNCTTAADGASCQVAISSTEPTRSGYVFSGWAESSTATSARYQAGDTITLTSDQALYAVWANEPSTPPETIPTYKLSLNNNTGSDTSANAAECSPTTAGGGCSLTIPSSTPTYKNHSFLGWSTSSDATAASFQPGDSLTVTQDITLYAVWQDETIAVHFINLGAGGNATLLENKGSYALVDTGPSKSYSRVANYLDSLGVKKLDFMIISHPHEDHNGNAVKLLNNYEVGTIYEKTYTNKDANANGAVATRYNQITSAAREKNISIVYIDKESKFKEAAGKSGSVYLNSSMRIHFFNTVQRIDREKQSDDKFDYFTSNYWAGKGENLNSLVNLIRVNSHNVLLMGDLNAYNILNYIMSNKVDVAYKNNQTLDVYSIPHHANYNCTGNKALGVSASYFLATNDVDGKLSNGSYRITNDTVLYTNGVTYNSCFKQMGRNYKDAYYSVNDKVDSQATIFDLTGSNVEVIGGYKGKQLTSR